MTTGTPSTRYGLECGSAAPADATQTVPTARQCRQRAAAATMATAASAATAAKTRVRRQVWRRYYIRKDGSKVFYGPSSAKSFKSKPSKSKPASSSASSYVHSSSSSKRKAAPELS